MKKMSCGAMLCGLLLWFSIFVAPLKAQAMKDALCSDSTYDYEDALSKSILFFEGQRSGKLRPDQRVNWRGDSALSDGKLENV